VERPFHIGDAMPNGVEDLSRRNLLCGQQAGKLVGGSLV
jgi:hypothetical protein